MIDYVLSDVAEIVDCEHKTAPLIESSDFYSIRTTDIANGKISFDKANRVDENTYFEWTKRALPETGDIVLAREAPVGEVGWIKEGYKVCLGQRTVLIKPKHSNVHGRFLLFYLANPDTKYELQVRSAGSVVAHLNMKDIRAFKITLPPLAEQKAIAAVLSSLDDKIDLLHRQNKTLEAMAETLFRQWFVEEAQEDWEVGPIKKYIDVGIGRTPPRNQHQWFSENQEDVKWISIKDLGREGVYAFETAEYLTREAVAQFNIPVIPENIVVLSFKMTVGRVAITTEQMLSNEAIAHFRFKAGTPFSVEYFYLFLKSYQYDLLGSTSSIVTAINSAMIKDMEIAIPSEALMKRFDGLVKKSFEKIRANQLQIRTLEQLRDTLLPKLMSGEVRVEV